jgi:hypothetical protein
MRKEVPEPINSGESACGHEMTPFKSTMVRRIGMAVRGEGALSAVAGGFANRP